MIDGMGDAITDIREKLVEEPWYGRTLDVPVSELGEPKHAPDLSPSADKTPSHDSSPELER